ncbi:hypothetical protein HOV23_gp064 [Pseudomonas phage Lana]|uniref:Uncharacterized protein n=1 Tax=Pseudomonas phage Lana TaxID=2530172 RepID=A0A481W7Q3_9CAUD|nr:hypothetical protein HOV23_gp064 [Pseudomonas phage Lana]QBJ04509.1 hypothetical protein [Pseudomonas phage Lana]
MISFEQHTKIQELLYEWAQLCQLYWTVQLDGQMSVQVMGSVRPEFHAVALQGAKRVLKEKAECIKADLHQLDFNISHLAPMREKIDATEN